ncbi:MAG TPA: hypothetical protein PKC59_15250 [Burkholderiaceae bacterium]|nr:hypothetical protein [Burkholderiaceae bacterium]HMX12132.1 hypothetical protein [Burkholderiaceae bacterium]HNG82205.1 hypothetical protein [Burkholderiaceae bacterium]
MTQDPRESLIDEFATVLANDPGALDPNDERYVPHLHGSDAEDQVRKLGTAIRRSEGSHLYYFSGQRGTGKSTELRRLRVELNGQPKVRAFMLDVLEYIGENHPIQTIDLLFVTALAFADCLRQRDELNEDLLKESVASRFGEWLKTDVEVTGLTVGGVKADFKKRQQSILQHIHSFDLARGEKLMAECREFIRQMAEIVRQRWRVEKVVLLVDSLERLRGVGDSAAAEMFARVVQVFDGDREQLRLPEVQVVYAVPPYLPYLTNVEQYVTLCKLATVRVCEPPAKAKRQPRSTGLELMRRVLDKRFARWAEVVSPEALDRLSLQSGGDLRQLLRRFLLDGVLDEATFALERLPLAADDPIIETTLAKHRVIFESMVTRDEYPLLEMIGASHALELPARKDWPTVARFFDIRAVLNYRNGVDWLDLNPLLWPLIDRHAAGSHGSASPDASSPAAAASA